MPSRASFQLPPMADEYDGGADPTEAPESVEPAVPTRRKAQSQAEQAGWADEGKGERTSGGFGPLGLIAAALLIMVAVYFGATLLMK